METKKQTPVEWLIESLEKLEYNLEKGIISLDDYFINVKWVKDQSKALEKEQIMDAHKTGWLEGNNPLIFKIGSEQYYKDTYEK